MMSVDHDVRCHYVRVPYNVFGVSKYISHIPYHIIPKPIDRYLHTDMFGLPLEGSGRQDVRPYT